MQNIKLIAVGALLITSFHIFAADDIIPVVPASQAKADLPKHPAIKTAIPEERIDDTKTLIVESGVNEIIPVALYHANRIVTPFAAPLVNTSSTEDISVVDNVIYVTPGSEFPVTFFITETGSQDAAISLTLQPRKIPPRQITLILNSENVGMVSTTAAKSWEEAQPYLKTIEELFRNLALSAVPSGYSFLAKPIGELPACRQAGLKVDFAGGQMVRGHHLNVYIGLATNVSAAPIEVDPSECADWNVAAATSFPKVVVTPGDTTEVYVAVKANTQEIKKVTRPSLLGGNR